MNNEEEKKLYPLMILTCKYNLEEKKDFNKWKNETLAIRLYNL